MYYFDNPEKTPFNMIMGVTLDQREYFRDYWLTQKGKLLQDQIYMLDWYAWNLCEIYDVTCCSEKPKKHLPYQCEFDNGIVSSYAKGVYVGYMPQRQ